MHASQDDISHLVGNSTLLINLLTLCSLQIIGLVSGKDRKVEPCVTIGYGIIGQNKDMHAPEYGRYHELMKILARNSDFNYGKDVKALTVGNQQTMYDYLEDHQN